MQGKFCATCDHYSPIPGKTQARNGPDGTVVDIPTGECTLEPPGVYMKSIDGVLAPGEVALIDPKTNIPIIGADTSKVPVPYEVALRVSYQAFWPVMLADQGCGRWKKNREYRDPELVMSRPRKELLPS